MKTMVLVQFCANSSLKMWFFSVVDEKSVTDAAFPDCFLVHQLLLRFNCLTKTQSKLILHSHKTWQVWQIKTWCRRVHNWRNNCPFLTCKLWSWSILIISFYIISQPNRTLHHRFWRFGYRNHSFFAILSQLHRIHKNAISQVWLRHIT